MKHKFRYILLLIFIVQISCGQNEIIIEKNKITTETELNFFESEKRGIKSSNGVIYYVENDLQTLTAYENGKTKWKTNIIKTLGKPLVGKSEIRFVQLKKDSVYLVYGKHSYANVDIINGNISDLGSD